MRSSILSFPDRGVGGSSRYPGNCSGHVVEALLRHFHPRFVVDPMEGSGTTGDVCRRLGIPYRGFDLRTGYDATRVPLVEVLGDRHPDFVFLHPPYHTMIPYSGRVWGDRPHPADLSHCPSLPQFQERLATVLHSCMEALVPHGHLAVLIGDLRRNGHYTPLLPLVLRALPDDLLVSILIKEQHHLSSDSKHYARSFIPIRHEYLALFEKRQARP